SMTSISPSRYSTRSANWSGRCGGRFHVPQPPLVLGFASDSLVRSLGRVRVRADRRAMIGKSVCRAVRASRGFRSPGRHSSKDVTGLLRLAHNDTCCHCEEPSDDAISLPLAPIRRRGMSSKSDDLTVETYRFADDGTVPNNSLPLVVYRG